MARADRVTVSAVELSQVGPLLEEAHHPAQGVIEMKVRVRAGTPSLFGSPIDRTIVRRYRFQVYRVHGASGAAPLWSQVRLMPQPLAQWVTP